MPTVPRITGPEVKQTALPKVQIDPAAPIEAFGGGTDAVFREVEKLAAIAQDTALKARQDADQVMDLSTTDELAQASLRIKTAAQQKRGEHAFTVPDEAGAEFDKAAEEIAKKLRTDSQRQTFFAKRLAYRRSIDEFAQEHVGAERRRFDDEKFESFLLNERNDAVFDYRNPKRVAASISRQQAEAALYAKRNGKPKEWVDLKVAEVTSKTHSEVIQRMVVNGEYDEAKVYLAKNQTPGMGLTLADLEKQIKSADEASRKDAYVALANIIDKDRVSGLAAAQQHPAWAKLEPGQRNVLENRWADPPTDPKRWLKFVDLARTSPAEVAKLDRATFETEYWGHFGSAERKQAESLWLSASKAASDTNASNQFKGILNDEELIIDGMRQAMVDGFGAGDTVSSVLKSAPKAEAYVAFRGRVDQQYASFTRANGKAPDYEQKKVLIRELLQRRAFEAVGWDTEKPVAAMTDSELKTVYTPLASIPAGDKAQLLGLARAKGVIRPEVSDDRAMVLIRKRIETAYAAALLGGDRAQLEKILAGQE